jgi:hypothetical protein
LVEPTLSSLVDSVSFALGGPLFCLRRAVVLFGSGVCLRQAAVLSRFDLVFGFSWRTFGERMSMVGEYLFGETSV